MIETEVSESEGELDDTVGGVVSELFEPSSLLLLQEMIVRLKRNMEKMMSICLTWFPFVGLGKPKLYQNLGYFTRIGGVGIEDIFGKISEEFES